MDSKDFVKKIAVEGTPAEKRELFSFNSSTPREVVLNKFKLFARSQYARYFTHAAAPYHDDFVLDYIDSYRGISNVLEAAHRDGAKTAILKLFTTFVILNDTEHIRRYIKVNSKELSNAKQFVTDVYNMMIEAMPIYGDLFLDEENKKIKREETQGSFTTIHQVKVKSATVGQDQRGNLQDAYRPDWQIFEDIEDSTSVTSQAVTLSNRRRIQEAIDGRAKKSKYVVNCNYISEDANVQWFMDKKSVRTRITPIAEGITYGRDEDGVKCLVKAEPLWSAFDFDDLQERFQDSEDWYGEFLCQPANEENKYFDLGLVQHQLENVAREPDRKSGDIWYWGNYTPDYDYGLGSDHAMGFGGDANTAVLLNFTTGEMVASHADNMLSPDLSAHEYARLGSEFGNCIWGWETNNECGGTVTATVKQIGYPRMYQWEVKDTVSNVISKRLGWQTNNKTKNQMLTAFRNDFNKGKLKIYDARLLKEMKAYTKSDAAERTTGLATRHFDLLIAACIANQMKGHAEGSSSTKDFYANLERKKRVRR